MRLDGKGAHFINARGWNDTHASEIGNAIMFFFKFLLLMYDTESVGSSRCHADYRSEKNAYEQTVKLAALGSNANKSELAMLRSLTKSDRMVNLRFSHDVHEERKKILAAKASGKPNPAKVAKVAPAKRAAATAAASIPVSKVPLDLSCYATGFSVRIDSTKNVREVDEDVVEKSSHIWEHVRNGMIQSAPAPMRAVAPAPAAAVAEETNPDHRPTAYRGPDDPIRNKITFTVTSIPIAGGDIRNPLDIAGVYVRFLVHDDNINTGVFNDALVENANRRRSNALSGDKRSNRSGPPEMFPNYTSLFETDHPAGNNVTMDTYFKHALVLNPSLKRGTTHDALFQKMNTRNPNSDFYLSNLLTTDLACETAIDAGCDPAIMTSGAWWSPNTCIARYPPLEVATTYVYLASAVFWKRESHIGMFEQYFPHIDMDSDFLATLVAGGKVDRFLGLEPGENPAPEDIDGEGMAQMRSAFDRFRDMIQNNHLIERSALLSNTLVDYQTNNEFVHRAAEAKLINNRVAQYKPSHYETTYDDVQKIIKQHPDDWRLHLEFDPGLELRVEECERYNELCNKAQLACTKTFMGLWQTDGDIDGLPVPEPIRALLKWFRDNQHSRFPHVSREFIMWDPDLGVFGNSMLRQLKFYSCVGRVLQPIVCMLAEGLFSCYRWSPAQLAFNFLLHGRYDTGKSFMAITILLRMTTVPGTVKTFCAATPAADTTQNHKYDIIIASDEVMPWKVNEQEAKRVQNLVNKEKTKLTERKVGTEVFCKERAPNGEDVRWSRTITSDHFVSLVETTNALVEETAALSSRYFRMVIPAPRVPAREMQGEMGASLDEHARTYLQLNQFLSAGAYKLIQCGGMLEPDLQLFHDISNRVIDYLVDQRAIDKDQGNRNLDIMKPYVIQCIIHNAIHCVFDMPSGPHYRKPFRPEMLYDLQPYMYATVDIVWWCWTSMASGWIDQGKRNVIRAAIKAAEVHDWVEGSSPYFMYEHDVADKIPWRRRDNPVARQNKVAGAPPDGNAKLIDLQYITLQGSFSNVCRSISERTVPHLDYTDVKGILDVLSKTMVTLPGGGYRPQEESTFKRWHKYTTLPGEDALPGVKETDDDGTMMPLLYRFRDIRPEAARVQRTEADVPRIGADAKNTVVDLSDVRQCVYIMPHVADSFSNSKIIDALKFATIHRNMRVGKILMGLPSDTDPAQLQVLHCPREYVDKLVKELDNAAGWDIRGKWKGNPDVPEAERGMARSHGICFNRRGAISKADSIYFTYAPAAPVRVGESASWSIKAHHDVDSISSVQLRSFDLDADSAKRRHIICGRPLDEPVRTPENILKGFIAATLAAGEYPDWHANVDYPHENIVENANLAAIWRHSSDIATAPTVFASNVVRDQDYNKPRKKDAEAQIADRVRKDQLERVPRASGAPQAAEGASIELPSMSHRRGKSAHETTAQKRTREALDEVEAE